MDGTLVVRIENGSNKKASLTPVFITNEMSSAHVDIPSHFI